MGQLVRVGPWSAEVMLITDPEAAVPVQVVRSGERTIAVGTGDSRELQIALPAGHRRREGRRPAGHLRPGRRVPGRRSGGQGHREHAAIRTTCWRMCAWHRWRSWTAAASCCALWFDPPTRRHRLAADAGHAATCVSRGSGDAEPRAAQAEAAATADTAPAATPPRALPRPPHVRPRGASRAARQTQPWQLRCQDAEPAAPASCRPHPPEAQ